MQDTQMEVGSPRTSAKPSSAIDSAVDEVSAELRDVSLSIWNKPELALNEVHAHAVLTSFMQKSGFEVTPSAYGLETAFEARYTHVSSRPDAEPGRVVGFNSEFDALPGIGHACGHNLIAVIGCAAAIATARALREADANGTVVLLGTPAEEDVGGKKIMLERGAYKDMDVALMAHPLGQGLSGVMQSFAVQVVKVEYTGESTHPNFAYTARNALDAAVTAYQSINAMRLHMRPSQKCFGVIKGTDNLKSNIVPSKVSLEYNLRADTQKDLVELQKRVNACFEAAATATLCTVEITELLSYMDTVVCDPLAEIYIDIMEKQHGRKQDRLISPKGGSDFGNVTWQIPGLQPGFNIGSLYAHSPGFAAQAASEDAHIEAMTVAKGLAATGFRIATDAAACQALKDWHKVNAVL